MDLERMKNELLIKNALHNQDEDHPSKAKAKILEEVPIRQIYEQAQYIENVLLPRIAKSRGADSEDYKFFRTVFKTLLWSIAVSDRHNYMERKLQQVTLFKQCFEDRAILLEGELLKYTTMEDLFLSDGLDRIARVMSKRAEDLLNKKT